MDARNGSVEHECSAPSSLPAASSARHNGSHKAVQFKRSDTRSTNSSEASTDHMTKLKATAVRRSPSPAVFNRSGIRSRIPHRSTTPPPSRNGSSLTQQNSHSRNGSMRMESFPPSRHGISPSRNGVSHPTLTHAVTMPNSCHDSAPVPHTKPHNGSARTPTFIPTDTTRVFNSAIPTDKHNMRPTSGPAFFNNPGALRPDGTPINIPLPPCSTLQAKSALHERGLVALQEYRRLRKERMHAAWLARQQQYIPSQAPCPPAGYSHQSSQYTIKQPPFLVGRPRTSSNPPPPQGATHTPSSRGRSITPGSSSSGNRGRTPFAADRPQTSRRASSVCSYDRTTLPPAAPPSSGPPRRSSRSRNSPACSASLSYNPSRSDMPPGTGSIASSPPLAPVGTSPVLRVSPKVTPKFRGVHRTDSQMHAKAANLRPQSPPSLRLADQSTSSTISERGSARDDGVGGSASAGLGAGMEDMLLQQVTALLQEKSQWTAERQRLEKEVEQLHELVEYLLEHFNVELDDGDAPLATLPVGLQPPGGVQSHSLDVITPSPGDPGELTARGISASATALP